MAYPGFEGDEFEDHFHSEEAGEQHIEDIHSFAEGLRLAMMLQTHKLIKKIRFVYLSTCVLVQLLSILTCMARQMVLRRMRVNIRYSK